MSKFYTLPLETSIAKRGATHALELDFNDIVALGANATGTISPITVDAKTAFAGILAELVTPFVTAEAGNISLTITVGDGGSATRYLASQELNAAGTYVTIQGGANSVYQYTVGDTIDVFVANTALKNLNTYTAGRVIIYLQEIKVTQVNQNLPGNYPAL